jgi:flavodoxin
MNILVVYESYFGNTEQIARAITESLNQAQGTDGNVRLVHVGQAKPEALAGVDLLVVGSPTRGFRPTEAKIAFLKGIPSGALNGIRVAAFDTRLEMETIKSKPLRWFINRGGYAAKHIAQSLQESGGGLAAPPEGFLVMGEQGPLKDGELERAAAWAKGLI